MSATRLSPTANLLRNSRLFSLPSPLPRPASDFTGTANFDSETATLPYPTRAAIETTESSLGRGDWGLKRALPLKSTTRTSTPTIYIDNIDSIDHITDFGSAADHTRTLQKWQEMNMPISMYSRLGRASGQQTPSPQSVFEPEFDNTESSSDKSRERWKFQGPWLAGKTHGEFQEYLSKKVKSRKQDFRQFLSERLERAKAASRRRTIIESGGDPDSLQQSGPDQTRISEDEIDGFIKFLRKDEEHLQTLVIDFLDLPREQRPQRLSGVRSKYNEKGPPSTHPSAGLSYLRTASHTFNHPVHGPQEEKPPVLARVLRAQNEQGKSKGRAVIGVGGIVTEDDKQPFTREDELPGVGNFDPDIPGGGKLWVQPKRAAVDPLGRIQLGVKRAEKNALNVMRTDESGLEERLPAAAIASASDRMAPELVSSRPSRVRGTQGYGLENIGGIEGSGRARPFDDKTDLTSLLKVALQQSEGLKGSRE